MRPKSTVSLGGRYSACQLSDLVAYLELVPVEVFVVTKASSPGLASTEVHMYIPVMIHTQSALCLH